VGQNKRLLLSLFSLSKKNQKPLAIYLSRLAFQHQTLATAFVSSRTRVLQTIAQELSPTLGTRHPQPPSPIQFDDNDFFFFATARLIERTALPFDFASTSR
jgi:hypothetical protein